MLNLNDIDFSSVTNRNEKKVRKAIGLFFKDPNNSNLLSVLKAKDIQDIYALALNSLPARYAHQTTIVLNEQLKTTDCVSVVNSVVEVVLNNPKK